LIDYSIKGKYSYFLFLSVICIKIYYNKINCFHYYLFGTFQAN
jgi:hypothetical protein